MEYFEFQSGVAKINPRRGGGGQGANNREKTDIFLCYITTIAVKKTRKRQYFRNSELQPNSEATLCSPTFNSAYVGHNFDTEF